MYPYNLQYIADEKGNPISVIVPIHQWEIILTQLEKTQHSQQHPSIAELFDELENIKEDTDLEILTRCDRTNPLEHF